MRTTSTLAGSPHASALALFISPTVCHICFCGLRHYPAHESESHVAVRDLLLGNVCRDCDCGQLADVVHSALVKLAVAIPYHGVKRVLFDKPNLAVKIHRACVVFRDGESQSAKPS